MPPKKPQPLSTYEQGLLRSYLDNPDLLSIEDREEGFRLAKTYLNTGQGEMTNAPEPSIEPDPAVTTGPRPRLRFETASTPRIGALPDTTFLGVTLPSYNKILNALPEGSWGQQAVEAVHAATLGAPGPGHADLEPAAKMAVRGLNAIPAGFSATMGSLLRKPGELVPALGEGFKATMEATKTPIGDDPSMGSVVEDFTGKEFSTGQRLLMDLTNPGDWVDPFPSLAGLKAIGAAGPFMGKTLMKWLLKATNRGVSGAAEASALLTRLGPHLDAPQLRKLESALSNPTEAMEHLQYLLPEEIPALLLSNQGIDTFVRRSRELPDTRVMAAAAAMGDVKLGWYERSRLAIDHLFGDDADLFAGVLASTSPQTSVESNLTNALNFFVNWRAAGRPRDAKQVRKILAASVQGGTDKSAMNAWIPNVVRVVTDNSKTISGPKVDSFWSNLRMRQKETPYGKIGQDQTVVLDAWMSHIFGVPGEKWFSGRSIVDEVRQAGDPGLTATYLAGTAKVRAVAKSLGVSPAEAQETMWSTAYALYNKSKKLRLTPEEVINRGLLTAEDIGGTPDFATLLGEGSYKAIVSRDADLASRVPSLSGIPARPSRRLPRGSDEDIATFARQLGVLQDARAAEKGVSTGVMANESLGMVIPSGFAGVPVTTSILPRGEVSPSQLNSGASDIANARRNPFGHNAALRAVVGEEAPQQARMIGGTGTMRDVLPDGEQVVQQGPITSEGLIVPSDRKARRAVESQVRAVTDFQAGLTGQTSQSHFLIDTRAPQDRWNAVDISGRTNSKPIQAKQFKAFVEALPPGWMAVQKSGDKIKGVQLLHLDPVTRAPLPVVPEDVALLQDLMQTHIPQVDAKKRPLQWNLRPGEDVAEDGYRLIAGGAEPGSGTRTARMAGKGSDWRRLSKAQRDAADPHLRREAAAILKMADRLGRTLRGDERNMLTLVAKGGPSALARAMKDPSQVLPALAALGIGLPAALGSPEESPQY